MQEFLCEQRSETDSGKRHRWGQILRAKIRGWEKQIVTERAEEEVRAKEIIITFALWHAD